MMQKRDNSQGLAAHGRSDTALGLKLSRGQRYAVYAISAGVWLTGVVWLVFHYYMQTEGPFGIQKHPMETTSLKLHGAVSFAFLWIFGSLWWTHIVRGWVRNWHRHSGAVLTGVGIVLSVTGWGLYYFVDRQLREWTSLTHWILGLAALAAFLLHWVSRALPGRVG